MSTSIPPASPPTMDEPQLYQFVHGQLSLGKFDADVVNALVAKGVPADRASTMVQTARAQRAAAYQVAIRRRGKRRVLYGVIAFVIGALVTVGSYSAATSSATGGTYILAFGPILFGLYSIARGVSDLTRR